MKPTALLGMLDVLQSHSKPTVASTGKPDFGKSISPSWSCLDPSFSSGSMNSFMIWGLLTGSRMPEALHHGQLMSSPLPWSPRWKWYSFLQAGISWGLYGA